MPAKTLGEGLGISMVTAGQDLQHPRALPAGRISPLDSSWIIHQNAFEMC
jgi:hypothetical protein